MTCEHVLDAMLDADLPDVIHDATSPLAVHVRGCSRCRRVADQLMNDTRLLASAVAAAAVPVRRRVTVRTVALAPAAVAAALLVMVTMRQQSPVPVGQTAVMLPALVVEPVPPASPNASMESPTPLLRAFPRAQPMVAARLSAPVAIDPPVASNAVTVTPPAGTTALVMHTSDPKLVVVWLY